MILKSSLLCVRTGSCEISNLMSYPIIDQKSVYLHKTQDLPYPQFTPGSTMGYQADFAVSLQV